MELNNHKERTEGALAAMRAVRRRDGSWSGGLTVVPAGSRHKELTPLAEALIATHNSNVEAFGAFALKMARMNAAGPIESDVAAEKLPALGQKHPLMLHAKLIAAFARTIGCNAATGARGEIRLGPAAREDG